MSPKTARRPLTVGALLLILTLTLSWLAMPAQPSQAAGTIIYVTPTGTGGGTSWADATSLYDALTSPPTPSEIWVAAGTYKRASTNRDASFPIVDNISVYGGFDGTETMLSERDWAANETILSGDIGTANDAGDNVYTVVKFFGTVGSSTVLDGFTITGGNADELTSDPALRLGGGIYLNDDDPILNNLIIRDNSAYAGGGISMESNSSPTLNNIVFIGNEAQNDPDNTFSEAGRGGGLYINSSNPTVNNATFYDNTAGTSGGAFYSTSFNTPTVNNSIVWGNTPASSQVGGGGGTNVTVNDSIIENDCPASLFTCSGIITSDPLFVDAAGGDLRLQIGPTTSPGIDAGDDTAVSVTVDIEGKDRTFDFDLSDPSPNTTVDTGAYEFVNDAPTALALNNQMSVPENFSGTMTVGSLDTTDPNSDVGDDHTYTLVVGTTNFEIDGANLQTNGTAFDYEALPATRQFTVEVQTKDLHGDTLNQQFVIDITDENETPTNTFLDGNDSSVATDIDEEQAIGTLVGVLTTDDPDQVDNGGDGDTHTYSLASGVLDNDQFQIGGTNNDELQTAAQFNYEDPNNTDKQYSVQVTTTDSEGNAIDRTFTVDINDVNEAPSSINLRLDDPTIDQPGTVDENISGITDVAHFDAVDVDLDNGGLGDDHTYSLPTGVLSNTLFTIDMGTGLLQTASGTTFDFETQSSFPVQVLTTDTGALSTTKTFTITINDLNEPPTALTFSDDTTESAVAENLPAGTGVGTFKTVDDDLRAGGIDDSHDYALVSGAGSTGNNVFQIAGNELQTRLALNYEAAPLLNGGPARGYTVRVRTTDEGGLFTEQIFSIEVTDENDSPSAINLFPDSIDEGAAANTVVGTLTTVDPDTGGSYSYALVPETNDNFLISGDQLIATQTFDYEEEQAYTLTVSSTNTQAGQDPVVFTQDVVVSINNVNEPPTGVIFDGGSADRTILDSLMTGDEVGMLEAVDPDIIVPGNDTFTYTLTDDAGGAFALGGANNDTLLVNIDTLDATVQDTYTVEVMVTDSGGETATSTLTINLIRQFNNTFLPVVRRN
jgi:hypothetical protein